MDKDVAIKVQNISKVYKLYDKPIDRLKESVNPFGKKYHKEFYALKDVSFEVKKGETVGIIGKNGSGKSTLLKIITGVLSQAFGAINVNGKISALLELGAGFNPELTGVENIYLNGTIMGYTKDEMDAKLEDILSFAEIGDFVYQPVKMYSSGMFVRLAFAVAINVDPDILIVDEALAVGDGRFQLKCFERIKALRESGKTILLVTHDLQSIRQFCDVAILFDRGVMLEVGNPNVIVNHYTRLLFSKKENELVEVKAKKPENEFLNSYIEVKQEYRYGNQNGSIEFFEVLDSQFKPARVVTSCDEVIVKIVVIAKKIIERPIYAMTIKNIKGLEVYGTNSYFQEMPFQSLKPEDKVEIIFRQQLNLIPGDYFISLGFVELLNGDIIPLDRRYDVAEIKVIPEGRDRSVGIANLKSNITIRLIDLEKTDEGLNHSKEDGHYVIQTKNNKKIISEDYLSLEEQQAIDEPWYHDFSLLGYPTIQREGIFYLNQESKQYHILGMIQIAIAICKDMGVAQPIGIELFCADGYYSNHAIQAGAAHIHGFDVDDKELLKARTISKILGKSKRIEFYKKDVFEIDDNYDFAICAGGLYHITDPEGLLRLLRRKVQGPLVIQTVYSLACNNEDYFESPAPGWTWGCRFSYKFLLSMLERSGWKIVYKKSNELKGNERLEDRGSAYILCIPS